MADFASSPSCPKRSLPEPIVVAEHAWAPGPARPRLADGAVHVWRADLTSAGDDLLELLSPEEQARAERFLRERDRRLWTRSRGLLRALLGRYLQVDGRTLRFATGAHGKPELLGDASRLVAEPARGSAASPTMSFNLSHSGGIALYAFATTAAVGVDVELANRPIDAVAIAARMFGAAEAARLQRLDPDSRERELLRAWARHEAELKCLGIGIGGSRQALRGENRPWVADLEVGGRAAAAVAVEAPPEELRCWTWSRPEAACAPGARGSSR
jgi:4'-phosphopantetheinyl transferase